MAEVTLVNVSKKFGDHIIAQDVNLKIKDGEFVAFVGPSGCGKSTLLRMIAGLEDISGGELFIGDTLMNDVPPSQRNIGMVFQSYALYPHMNVRDNMSFGLKLAKARRDEINKRVNAVAEILQLAHLLERKPKELSGGQRQRVAIGRTLVSEPQVFLLDEPLSNLDAALRVQMRVELSKLHKRLKRTMIYVTHDQIEAMTLADRIVVLRPSSHGVIGGVAQVGTPLELYHYPANRFVAGFIGSPKMNFLPAKVLAKGERGVHIKLPINKNINFWINVDGTNVEVGESVSLGIRPEHLWPKDGSAIQITGSVKVLEQLGYETQIHLDMPPIKQSLIYRESDIVLVEQGQEFVISINTDRCHLFKENGEALPRRYREKGC